MSKVDFLADIKAFHEKFKLAYDGKPRALPQDVAEFRRRFLQEEVDEYRADSYRLEYFLTMLTNLNKANASSDELALFRRNLLDNLAGCLDALVDEVYVALGTAYLHGFDFAEAWRRVHAANMKKVCAERAEDSKRGYIFDVVKPKDWVAPVLTDLVADHAHGETCDQP